MIVYHWLINKHHNSEIFITHKRVLGAGLLVEGNGVWKMIQFHIFKMSIATASNLLATSNIGPFVVYNLTHN